MIESRYSSGGDVRLLGSNHATIDLALLNRSRYINRHKLLFVQLIRVSTADNRVRIRAWFNKKNIIPIYSVHLRSRNHAATCRTRIQGTSCGVALLLAVNVLFTFGHALRHDLCSCGRRLR